MQIYSIGYQQIRKNNYQQRTQRVNFGTQTEKQLVEFLACENLGKLKLTFEAAKRMCEFLGHVVEFHKGSHASIHLKNNKGVLTLVIPHGAENNISLYCKRRLRCLITGRIQEAFRI